MTDREIELKLKQAVEACTPDVLDGVRSGCDALKGQVIEMPKTNSFRRFASMAAVLVLILGLSALGLFSTANRVASIVNIDVNPSIELKLDKNAKVLEANALNDDAVQILEGMELKGTNVNTAANALVGSLLKHGYIDKLANSILISVEDKNSDRGEKLQAEIAREVEAILSSASVNAAVLAQYVDRDDMEALAQEYGISQGKAALISRILTANPTYTFDELAELSVNDLNLILSNPKNSVEDVTVTGSVSDNAYIGADKARAIALSHAGLEESQVHDLHTDFDVEHGTLVYEVEFRTAADEYEYEIDAVTGNILDFSREAEKSKDPAPTASPAPQTDIGADKARDIALKHAGFSASGITELDIERENKDGRLIYSVEFRVGTGEYEYEISAEDGCILSYDIDVRETPAAASGTDIGAEAARRIALSHANFSESSLDEIEAESKISDGRLEYKIKFTSGTTEYKYVIDGATGSILDCDMETHEPETVHQSGKVISAEKAKDFALKHADIKSKLDWVTVERDEEDGQLIYSIEFAAGGIEYEYEVDASSGSILSWDSEQAETEYSKDNDKKDKDGDDHDDEDDD